MKKYQKIISVVVIIILVLGLIGYFSYRKIISLADEVNKLPQNEDAIRVMGAVEKSYLESRFLNVEEDMGGNEVEQILGIRYNVGITDRIGGKRIDTWLCPESEFLSRTNQVDCSIYVYFVDDKAVAKRWLRLEHFFYEVRWPGF